jgi:tetrahydromethanopterin S-methyltransferase subunit C
VKRTTRLFTFKQPVTLDIQGITFQNFDCQNCEGAILSAGDTSAVVTFKHNTVSKVNSYGVSTYHMILA